jgi:hypothetical protein
MKRIQEPIKGLSHWFGDRMQKRIYEFNEGSCNDKNILGLKGETNPHPRVLILNRLYNLRAPEVYYFFYLKSYSQIGD